MWDGRTEDSGGDTHAHAASQAVFAKPLSSVVSTMTDLASIPESREHRTQNARLALQALQQRLCACSAEETAPTAVLPQRDVSSGANSGRAAADDYLAKYLASLDVPGLADAAESSGVASGHAAADLCLPVFHQECKTWCEIEHETEYAKPDDSVKNG